jgi:hypothetical protein
MQVSSRPLRDIDWDSESKRSRLLVNVPIRDRNAPRYCSGYRCDCCELAAHSKGRVSSTAFKPRITVSSGGERGITRHLHKGPYQKKVIRIVACVNKRIRKGAVNCVSTQRHRWPCRWAPTRVFVRHEGKTLALIHKLEDVHGDYLRLCLVR